MIDRIYRKGYWVASRRVPAVMGYILAAGGVLAYIGTESPVASMAAFSVAVFGADMTLAPFVVVLY